jgi:hypothetical protein
MVETVEFRRYVHSGVHWPINGGLLVSPIWEVTQVLLGW